MKWGDAMVPLKELTKETILSKEVLEEVFDQEDELYRAELLASLGLRAAELKVKPEFRDMVAAYRRVAKEIKKQKERRRQPTLVENWTNFEGPYDNMLCKEWIASDEGVYLKNHNTGFTDILACYHPVLPIERLKNLETGEEQIKLDLIIFAGQDNMAGSGMLEEATVESIWNSGYEIRFGASNQVVGLRRLGNADELKTTLIPAFVNAYYNNTGAPVLAVPVSADSLGISSWKEGTVKFNELKAKIENSIDYVQTNTGSFTLRRVFMVWFQGERDVDDLNGYELSLIPFFKNVKTMGVEQIFMIRIGHLYRASGTSDDEKQRQRFNAYTKMIKKQTEFNRKSNLSVLVSVKAAALSLVKGGADTTNGKISDMMINQMKFSQLALDKHVYLHSTSNAGYNADRNGRRYHIDFAFLSPESVDGSVPVTHLYKTVTVLRLNNDILPENFVGNAYDVNFSDLNTTENGYQFEARYVEGTQAPEKETWLENHSVYISLEENQTNEV